MIYGGRIYKTNMDIKKYKLDIDNESLSLEIDFNVTLDATANVDGRKGNIEPRIQANVVIQGGLIEDVNNKVLDILKKDFYKTDDLMYTFRNWVYIVDKESPEGKHPHNHTRMTNLKTEGEWTWVYYASMPDKLEGDDGYIYFYDDGEETSFLPEVGDLVIFPAHYYHLPKVNPKSNKNRRIIGGITSQVSYKTKKTLM